MEVAFDPAKDAINIAEHGVSLAVGATIFDDHDHIVLTSIRPVDGEDR
ncbi:BrnT family toxin [Sphingomonas sp. SUN019]|nr:BrnT family toxin [Sphingomonas sp. SUN019]UVO51843.1 BrnT family toxin [Sphingomonas sp. SUN019]